MGCCYCCKKDQVKSYDEVREDFMSAGLFTLLMDATRDFARQKEASSTGKQNRVAVERDHHRCVELLVEHGGGAFMVNALNANAPLVFFAQSGNVQGLERLILGGGDVCRINTRTGAFPLLVAAMNGRLECLKMLLAHGADANQQSTDGDTPLLAAARSGHADCVRLLLQAGAEDSWRGDTNNLATTGTPLVAAAQRGYAEVLEVLLDDDAKATARAGGFDKDSAQSHALRAHYRRTLDMLSTGREAGGGGGGGGNGGGGGGAEAAGAANKKPETARRKEKPTRRTTRL